MPTSVIRIDGLNCERCVEVAVAALRALPGVKRAEVSGTRHTATVEHDQPGPGVSEMVRALREEGFGAGAE